MTTLERNILNQLHHLKSEQQELVLKWVQDLSHDQGVDGQSLLKFAGRIALDDLALMENAIEEFEQIEAHDW